MEKLKLFATMSDRPLKAPGLSGAHLEKFAQARFLLLGACEMSEACLSILLASGARHVTLVDTSLVRLAALEAKYSFLREDPETESVTIQYRLVESFTESAIEGLVLEHDCILEFLSNWQEKLLLSDLCMTALKPLLHIAGFGLRFHLYAMVPGHSACLRCVISKLGIEDAIVTPSTSGILVPLIVLFAGAYAFCAFKLVTKFGASQTNELLQFDALSGELEVLRGFDPQSDCPDCGKPGLR